MSDPAAPASIPSVPDDRVRELARAYRVGTGYWGWDGALKPVAVSTLVSVLAALGVTATTEAEVDAALAARELAPWRRLLPPSVVVREGAHRIVHVHLPHGTFVDVSLRLEDGSRRPVRQVDDFEQPREVDGVLTGRASFDLPTDLPLGWHTLRAATPEDAAEAALVVSPRRLSVADRLGTQTWGLQTQLYSVRSLRSWGLGDLADLRDLCAISGAEFDADFLLVNPLHAAEPTAPMENSPYLPTTRRFFNPIYIRIEDIPEVAHLEPKARQQVSKQFAKVSDANLSADLIDRDAVLTAKTKALREVFEVPRSTGRQIAFETFRAREGQGLEDFALWCVLRERFSETDPRWAELAPSPDSEFARETRLAKANRVTFYCWLQWILDQQLAGAAATAEDAGMRIGVVHDLAVGVHRFGSDAWAMHDTYAHGIGVGAPADQYNQQGQNWMQPPWRPDALAELGYAPLRDMLRTVLRHAGALRIDHVLGLFRLWWVPPGAEAKDGTYVYYDHEAMIGVLALEAERAGAIIIGEDLGTFEPWVRDYLAERGILGTSILWFENEGETPLPPERYRTGSLASVNTHDLPPTAGYLAGEHVTLRDRLGLLERGLDEERAADRAAQEVVLAEVRRRGLLSEGASVQETVEALHVYLAQAPSLLLGVSLVDGVGENRIQNQPGTDKEYPNWMVPLADADGNVVLVDDLAANPRMRSLVDAVAGALRAKDRPRD